MTKPARTVFLGSGSFAVPIVSALAEHPSAELVGVVTAPTKLGSRGRPTSPPVAVWAAAADVPAILQPTRLRSPEAILLVSALAPDLLVLADYGQIVPAQLLDLPRHGALNLHPSLLPRHRGATPIPAAILAGDAETGVSLMRMDAGLDSGPVIAQSRRALGPTETAPELEAALAADAAALLDDKLAAWLGGDLEPNPQSGDSVTLTRPLTREDGRLDPSRPAEYLERQVRAYQPWPGSFVDTAEGRIVVWRAVPRSDPRDEPGTLVELIDGGLGVTLSDGTLELAEVQPAGGRRMFGAELLRGRPNLDRSRIVVPDPAPGDGSG